MNTRNLVIMTAGATFIASAASAQFVRSYQSAGGPFEISDVLGPTVITIDVPSDPITSDIIADFKEVSLLGFSHTWAGDLTITLEHNGVSVTLLDQPGVPESTFGDSADFDGSDYMWTEDGLVYDSDLFGTTVPAPGPYGPVSGSFTAFEGMDKTGLWTLTLTDAAGGDDGSIDGFRIVMNNIPAPGALALLGLAGFTRRRRR